MDAVQLIMLLFRLGGVAASKIAAGTKAGKAIDIVAEVEQLGAAAYMYITAQTGAPIDFSQIPLEDPLAEASASSSSPAPAPSAKMASVTIIKSPAAESAEAIAAIPAADSRCPSCGAAGTATGAACVACGKVHQ